MSLAFCQECNNILWPVADRESKELNLKCQNCNFQQPASDDAVVYKNEIKVSEPFTFKDVWADNSLPRLTKECRRCRHKEAVYFQSASFLTEDPMTLYFVCCNPNCGHQWVDESATKEK